MAEVYLEIVNRFIDEARNIRSFGVLRWGISVAEIPDVHFYSQAYAKTHTCPSITDTPTNSLVNILGMEAGARIVEVPEAHIGITDLVGNVDALFTWDLISCTGIAFKTGDQFGLAHFLAEREKDISFLSNLKDPIVRVRQDNEAFTKGYWPTVLSDSSRRYLSSAGEWNGMLVTRQGVTFLREVSSISSQSAFVVAQELRWRE